MEKFNLRIRMLRHGESRWFFTARCYAYVPSSCVCVSVILRYCIKTAKRGYITWHVLNFGCPIHISGVAEARALKLCTKGKYFKLGQRDDKSPLRGAWFCSRDPFFVCTAVELATKSPLHSVICDQPCPGRWLLIITPPTVDASAAYTKA